MIVGVAVAIAATVSSGVVSAQNLGGASNNKWWPEMLDLRPLRQQSIASDPMGPDFNYVERFNKLDLNAVKKDIEKQLTSTDARLSRIEETTQNIYNYLLNQKK